jgi:hypothetical protein
MYVWESLFDLYGIRVAGVAPQADACDRLRFQRALLATLPGRSSRSSTGDAGTAEIRGHNDNLSALVYMIEAGLLLLLADQKESTPPIAPPGAAHRRFGRSTGRCVWWRQRRGGLKST